MIQPTLTEKQWQFYDEFGYLMLGPTLTISQLEDLQTRINDVMQGTAPLDYDKLLMQLDSETGKYNDAGTQSKGFKGPTLNYRKIQDLEADPLFLQYLQNPLFKQICAKVYGPSTPIAAFRAMFMNKPAKKGTFLPWHQDRWDILDKDPLITTWTALDPATIANGCVQVIPGTHKLGLINKAHPSGFLTEQQVQQLCPPEKRVFLELDPGECVLMHNWLIHSSDVNATDTPRRAFSVCYLDANTKSSNGDAYTTVFPI